MIFAFYNFSFSQLYDLNENPNLTEEREYFLKFINYLKSYNQFECNGTYYYHNLKNKTIEESKFDGIIFRNISDTIVKVSFLLNLHDVISFYNNHISYKFDKLKKLIYFEKIKSEKFKMNITCNVVHFNNGNSILDNISVANFNVTEGYFDIEGD
jgi:hypothetical protein